MIGHTGQVLGTVQDVLLDDGESVGIVVRPNGLFAHDVVVQVRFLDRSDDLALFLRMTPEDVGSCPDSPALSRRSERQAAHEPGVTRMPVADPRSSPSRQQR